MLTFFAVIFYDQPVNRNIAVEVNKNCNQAIMSAVISQTKNDPEGAAGILLVPIAQLCDCILPSPANQMNYITFVDHLWEFYRLDLKRPQ